jgi:hypothetical protein
VRIINSNAGPARGIKRHSVAIRQRNRRCCTRVARFESIARIRVDVNRRGIGWWPEKIVWIADTNGARRWPGPVRDAVLLGHFERERGRLGDGSVVVTGSYHEGVGACAVRGQHGLGAAVKVGPDKGFRAAVEGDVKSFDLGERTRGEEEGAGHADAAGRF